ncbi:hypothetical protein [Streptomyces alanosinicus]|uniref:Uncharacterized protein n=1 Tax=Streptomyces alanosinicus TaxID=68171 RepID=A0A918YPK6_9ACTN|nr:hypothetical protein [Streptomyces alanosinicus]GHE10965.1 hypothetical protein GCM10010339_68880 [Streptomyces alanosinicus]
MDRDQTLRDLDQLVEPNGAVVLASGGAPGDLEPAPWLQAIVNVRTRYLGPERRAGSGTYSHPKERHQDVLARSPFSNVETARWDRTVTRTLDEVIGLQFSYSYSSPAITPNSATTRAPSNATCARPSASSTPTASSTKSYAPKPSSPSDPDDPRVAVWPTPPLCGQAAARP